LRTFPLRVQWPKQSRTNAGRSGGTLGVVPSSFPAWASPRARGADARDRLGANDAHRERRVFASHQELAPLEVAEVTLISLGARLDSGVVLGDLTDPSLDIPSTATVSAGRLWAVNLRFTTPPETSTPYWTTRLPLRP
jgi:hypothetical protein